MRPALFGGAFFDQVDAALQRSDAAHDRRHHVGQVADRRQCHQHRGDEGHEAAHRLAAGGALPQRDHDHSRHRTRRHDLRQRRHRRRRGHVFQHQAPQRVAQLLEAVRLCLAGAVQAHDPPGQHVFLDHVGEVVVGALAFLGQALHAPAGGAHHPGDGGEQQADEQGERPVQVQQVNQQRGQRQRVAHQREHRRHQLRGRALHLVDQHVGQAAGRMAGEQRRLGAQQVVEQAHAQRLHALVGGPGEGVLRCKPGQAPKREETDDRHRHDPHRDSPADETLVEQRLHQRRQGRLGNCC